MHELSPVLAKYLKLAYLFLPLGLAALAGICLLLAALRKALSGGTALALGGLAGIIVAGSLVLEAHNLSARHAALPGAESAAPGPDAAPGGAAQPVAATSAPASAPAADPGAIPAKALKIASIGYVVLPLGLAVLAGLTLLIATAGKTVNGASALALGGLAGVVVAGSVYSLRGPDGENLNLLAKSCAVCAEPASEGGAGASGGAGAGPAASAAPAPQYVTVEAAAQHAEAHERAVESVSTGLERMSAAHGETLRNLERRADALATENGQLRDQNGALAKDVGALQGELKATRAQVDALVKALLEAKQADPRGDAPPPAAAPAPAQPGPAAPGGPGGPGGG